MKFEALDTSAIAFSHFTVALYIFSAVCINVTFLITCSDVEETLQAIRKQIVQRVQFAKCRNPSNLQQTNFWTMIHVIALSFIVISTEYEFNAGPQH